MFAQAKKALPGLTSLALVVAAILALSGDRVLYGDPNGAIPLVMPETLGPWSAETMVFCQNDQCAASFLVSGLESGTDSCPICGGDMGDISLGEMTLLPDNTPIFRKAYRRAGHPDIMATFVFSGMERRSIHKPQRCLAAQGNRITDEYTLHIPISGDGRKREMPVRVLEISRPLREKDGTVSGQTHSAYVYWLFNPERETVHHWARLLRMLFDNAFRSYRPRWGYASITIPRDPQAPDAWKEELEDFLPRLYPTVVRLRRDLEARRDRVLRFSGHSWDTNEYEGDNAALTTHRKRDGRGKAEPSGE